MNEVYCSDDTGATRRTFIKNSLVIFAGASSLPGIHGIGFAATVDNHWGMIIDLNRCIGCQSCTIACKLQNRTVENRFCTSVIENEIGEYPLSRFSFTPIQCNHCEDPPCVPACPENATYKLSSGIVVTDWNRCVGDGLCVEACPYSARFLDPRFSNKVDKCDFCLNRLEMGLEPACVEVCASKARIWGDFKNPVGEFAEYIESGKLVSRKSKLGIKASVLYEKAGEEPA